MEHLSRMAIERSIAGRGPPGYADPEEDHLRGCEECLERKRAVLAEQADYLQRFPAPEFARTVVQRASSHAPVRRGPWWTQASLWVAAAAMTAGAVVLWQRSGPSPRSLDPRPGEPARALSVEGPGEVRLKGAASRLDTYVKRGSGAVSALQNGDTLSAGDQLAFTVTLAEPRYLLLLGVEAGGGVTRYFPAAGAAPAGPLAAGTAQLEVGVRLDDSRGEERMIALFSRAPLNEDEVRSRIALALAARRNAPGGEPEPLSLELGAEHAEIWFRK